MSAPGGIAAGRAYAGPHPDTVRRTFEQAFFARLLQGLLVGAGGGRVLNVGCGDGLVERLANGQLERYLGVDLCPRPATAVPGHASFVADDLRDGLGDVGRRPHDLYPGTFGVASHLAPAGLDRLLAEISAHARPGSLVALEALGLFSLEWPMLWSSDPGAGRLIPYRLAGDVGVHPWSARELAARFESAGITWVGAIDGTVQAGPKAGEYWPAVPRLRAALNALLAGDGSAAAELARPLGRLPAGSAAALHRGLAAARRVLARGVSSLEPAALCRALWALEPGTAGGYGHGMTVVGRAR